MPIGAPIQRQSLQRMVYESLRHAILAREIAPGEQIKIAELAASFKVSAIPVREALRQLEAEGMVTFGPQKRIVVNQLSMEDLHDIYTMLYPLDEMALKKCFERIDGESIKELEAINEKAAACQTASDWIRLNWKFHNKIYEVAGSPRLMQVLTGLRTGIRPYLCISFEENQRRVQANAEHMLILDALREGDWEKGRAAVRQHLENGCLAVETLLRREG